MAFARAAGYNNLPNGNFVPVIYSKKAQIAFRKKSVIQAITNTDFFGEIREFGDTVKIIKEPNITVASYSRGATVTTQELDDEEIVLTVDQANFFAFKVDDIEQKQAHHNWESLATDQGGYRLADKMDSEVLTYMTSRVTANNTDQSLQLGTTANPLEVTTPKSTNDFSPLGLLNRFKRLLDEKNVPEENRWFVADPFFYELLGDEESKVVSDDFVTKGILRNGKVTEGMLRGFELYQSNNLPSNGSGPSGTTTTDYGWVLAGHMSAVATAQQINKIESFRDPDSFADVVRGLHMYGRKDLRPEALAGAVYHTA